MRRRGTMTFAASLLALQLIQNPAFASRKPADVTACMGDASGMTFAKALQFIASGYDPSAKVTGSPTTAAPTFSDKAVSEIVKTFAAAYNIAPSSFKTLLCNLDGIYVDPNTFNGSWGYRDQSSFSNRYVALSTQLFDPSGTAINFDSYSTWRLNYILGLSYGYFYFGPAMHNQNISNDGKITVLAALAHEVGHIYWYDTVKQGGSYDYSKFCNGAFLDHSWKYKPAPDPWIALGHIQSGGEHADDSNSDNVSIADIALGKGKYQRLEQILTKLYDGRKSRWATALAAFSPNEDFVETFENVVLTYPGTSYALTSQSLYTYWGKLIGDTFDPKPKFQQKKDCFSNF